METKMITAVNSNVSPTIESGHSHEKDKETMNKTNWEEFISTSTIHGLHFIFEKRPIIQRLIWLLLLLLMFGLFIWQTSTLVMTFFEYRVASRVKLVNEHHSVFPAITICNFNQYRNSTPNMKRFLKVVEYKTPLYKHNVKRVNWTHFSDVNRMDMESIVNASAHQLKFDNETNKGMLYGCTWKGDPCYYSNFTSILTDMGLCYTFNSGKTGDVLMIDSPGDSFGLKLTMSVEQEEYIGSDTLSAGLKIRVHNQDEPPLVSSLGFAAMPGSHVFAAISKQRVISLEYPYETMCEHKKLSGIKAYTIPACREICKEDYVIKICNCSAYYYTKKDKDYQLCSVKDFFECVIPTEEKFSSSSLKDCHCPEPCNVTKYKAYLSYGKFPSLASNKVYANSSTEQMEKYRRDMLSIDIYFEDLYCNVIEQVPKLGLQSLLGELGGLLGLFLGASILTLAEVANAILMSVSTRLGICKS